MLCDTCTKLLKRYEDEYESEVIEKNIGHHRDPASIQSAAALDCYVCSTLWYTLSDETLAPSMAEFFKKEEIRAGEKQSTPPDPDIDGASREEFFTHARLERRELLDDDDSEPDGLTLYIQVGAESPDAESPIDLGSFSLQRLPSKLTPIPMMVKSDL